MSEQGAARKSGCELLGKVPRGSGSLREHPAIRELADRLKDPVPGPENWSPTRAEESLFVAYVEEQEQRGNRVGRTPLPVRPALGGVRGYGAVLFDEERDAMRVRAAIVQRLGHEPTADAEFVSALEAVHQDHPDLVDRFLANVQGTSATALAQYRAALRAPAYGPDWRDSYAWRDRFEEDWPEPLTPPPPRHASLGPGGVRDVQVGDEVPWGGRPKRIGGLDRQAVLSAAFRAVEHELRSMGARLPRGRSDARYCSVRPTVSAVWDELATILSELAGIQITGPQLAGLAKPPKTRARAQQRRRFGPDL